MLPASRVHIGRADRIGLCARAHVVKRSRAPQLPLAEHVADIPAAEARVAISPRSLLLVEHSLCLRVNMRVGMIIHEIKHGPYTSKVGL